MARGRSAFLAGAAAAAITLTGLGSSAGTRAWADPAPPPAPSRHILVIAHRGGEVGAPESTLAAFAHSIAAGVDGIVFDVRLTRDGVPVVLHDETLNRTTDCSGRVDRTTARRLRRCNAAHGFGKFGFQNVPTLDEALRFITTRSRHVKLYVHAKTVEDDHEADAIMSVMRRWQLADNPRATLLADNPDYLYLLQDSGARSLGLVFHDFDKDYALRSDWPVLFAWEAHLTASDLAEAARHGRLLLVSRDHPQSLEALLRMGVTAISVDDPTQTLRQLGRLPDN